MSQNPTPDAHRAQQAEELRRLLGDGLVTQLIAEFAEAFGFARTRWTRYVEDVHPDLKGASMSILNTIVRRGPMTATGIGQLLGMDKAFVSRQVTYLKDLGFVVATPNPEDKRVWILTGSESAKRALDGIHVHLAQSYEEQFAEWSEADLGQLVHSLRRFNQANNEHAD